MNTTRKASYDILILEDSHDDLALYKRRLLAIKGTTFNITETYCAEEAKEKASNQNFDCYIVDYNLPGENGLDFVRHLWEQKEQDHSDAAIVVITGCGSEAIVAEAFRLGVHEYITKSNVLDGLFERPIFSAIERATLTSQIKSFQEKLQQSNRDLSNFSHTAAHDLKAPLRRILSYCEILQEDAAMRINQEDKEILKRMEINARRMQNLVENLLSYSLIKYEKEEKEVVDLNILMQDVLEDMGHDIQETNTKIEISNLPTLPVYSMRIRQLFNNLISNAIKYKSQKTPHIIIKAEIEGDYAKFSVEDNGQGIPENRHAYIFEDFRRLYSDEQVEGTGLGLSICNKIVERHNGKIWVESKKGEGATFYFTIKIK